MSLIHKTHFPECSFADHLDGLEILQPDLGPLETQEAAAQKA
jgi:hypothetical protein